MSSKRCHCNGSRGTDCDWCQGSGWVTKNKRLSTAISNVGTSKQEKKKPVIKKVFQIFGSKANEGKKINLQPIKAKKTLSQRICALELDLKNDDILKESAEYFRLKIQTLISDLERIETGITKKQRGHYKKLKAKSVQIRNRFEEKFGKLIG